jgi:hypothetical protein
LFFYYTQAISANVILAIILYVLVLVVAPVVTLNLTSDPAVVVDKTGIFPPV